MQDYYDRLSVLLDRLPTHNSYRSNEELSKIFDEYKSILNAVSSVNEDYNRNTFMYFTELSDIEFDIKQSQTAKSQKEKEQSFKDALNHLREDISDLVRLIKLG